MDITEMINSMYDFLELNYREEIDKVSLSSVKVINLDHSLLQEFNPVLADFVLDRYDEVAQAIKVCGSDFLSKGSDEDTLDDHTSVVQVVQVSQISQVVQPLSFPVYISTNAHKVLHLLTLVKSASAKEICDVLKIDKRVLSKVFSRPDRGQGLVVQGMVDQLDDQNVDDQQKKWFITSEGIAYLNRLSSSFSNKARPALDVSNEVNFRWYNLPESTRVNIGNLRNKDLGKLLTVEAVIRRKGDVRPRATMSRFECPTCGNVLSVVQLDPRSYKQPSRCSCGRKGLFKLLNNALADVQHLTIEDWGNNIDTRNEVKRLEVLFKDDLCDRQGEALVGNRVLFYGVLREVQKENHGVKSADFDIYLEINNFKNLDDKSIKLSSDDIQQIKDYASEQGNQVLKNLASRFSPNIIGNEHIKMALLLQLVSRDAFKFKTRLRLHVHLFGKPGIAKSDLGLFSFAVSHKSIYVDVSKATGVGLTASAEKDERTKSWVLEAGALVLAGEGLAFLDELDKADPLQLKGLGEPLEKGTITVAKGGLGSQTLPGIAKVLSAGNFVDGYKGGLVDHRSLNLQHHLLDRYDLILMGEKLERKLVRNKMFSSEENDVQVEMDFIRKYCFYAYHHNVSVDLSSEVQSILGDFDEELSKVADYNDMQISYRIINTLRRLTLASAKLRLANHAEAYDARVAVNLLKRSFTDRGLTFHDEVQLI